MEEKVIDIQELAQDGHNFNKGNEQGQQLMERSFKELGAGRSILLDRNGNIIAGNKSQKAAIAAGIKKVRVIETTGDELVAVKRTDVDIDSTEGRKMAYLDNLTEQMNQPGYQDTFTIPRKDGTMMPTLNPLHEYRGKAVAKFQQGMERLRAEAIKRKLQARQFK